MSTDGMSPIEIESAIHHILRDVYTVEGRLIWLTSRNKHLGLQSPRDLIAGGQEALVVAEARRLAAI